MNRRKDDYYSVALLTPAQMAEADRLAIEGGISGIELMRQAGKALFRFIEDGHLPRGANAKIACLAGPGNNGGDAFVVAECFRTNGFVVELFLLCDHEDLSGDAAIAASEFGGTVRELREFVPSDFAVIVDGLFGAGLSRPIEGDVADVIDRVNASPSIVVSIDLPSGISGETGAVLGTAIRAHHTVTFFRRKPGHVLDPGRTHCGGLALRPIGISDEVLEKIVPGVFMNDPRFWGAGFRWPAGASHKYDRGHAVVFSGPSTRTGAARLAATATLRAGAGLVTLFSPPSALLVNASHLTTIMLERCGSVDELRQHLADERLNAFVLGPGFGVGEQARDYARAILRAGRRLVLDADGISSFSAHADTLFEAAREKTSESWRRLVLTPHAGEFARLFPDLAADAALSKLGRAKAAASRAGAVVVLKGRDTVIAEPRGRAAINTNGTPWLATAGSGDVLGGFICGQLAQGAPSFEAACAGVWLHGKAAEAFGEGLIAEDLPATLPAVLHALRTDRDALFAEGDEGTSSGGYG